MAWTLYALLRVPAPPPVSLSHFTKKHTAHNSKQLLLLGKARAKRVHITNSFADCEIRLRDCVCGGVLL